MKQTWHVSIIGLLACTLTLTAWAYAQSAPPSTGEPSTAGGPGMGAPPGGGGGGALVLPPAAATEAAPTKSPAGPPRHPQGGMDGVSRRGGQGVGMPGGMMLGPRPGGPAAGRPLMGGGMSPYGGAEPPPLSDEPRSLRVMMLQHADPATVVSMINELGLPSGGPRCFVDARTNSLILLATEEESRLAEDLIRKLDVPAQEPATDKTVRIYQVRYASVKSLAVTLQQLLGPRGTIAIDDRSNQLVVSGDARVQEMAGNIVSQLDQAVPTAAPARQTRHSYRVRLTWLASNTDGVDIPPDMQDVAREMAEIGVDKLVLVAQALVQTFPSEQFRIQCTPALNGPCMLSLEGMLDEDADAPQLRLKLKATGRVSAGQPGQPMPPGMMAEIASLDTALAAPIGHKTVIGMTPTADSTSVFVIQLTRSDAEGRPVGSPPVQKTLVEPPRPRDIPPQPGPVRR